MENGGYQYDWLYKLAGMKVEGAVTLVVEYTIPVPVLGRLAEVGYN